MESRNPKPGANFWKYPVGLVAILAPLLIIWRIDLGMAGGEYALNTWFIGYNGEYFRQHWSFPETLQTSERVGAAAPMFYGYLLFKLAGLLSLIHGPHLAVRIIVVFCLAAVYLSVRHTLRGFGATESLAAAGAGALCWAVYPLTNLYNRFAFAEFVAASCLTCSCCFWARFFLDSRRAAGYQTALTAGLFQTLAAGTHPITGMLSLPFPVLLYALHWIVPVPERPSAGHQHAALALSAVFGFLVLSPWLYAYSVVGEKLAINTSFLPGLGYFDGGNVTSAVIRLSPIPVDYQHIDPASPRLGVAHLDTQLNLPLLVAALVLLVTVARQLSRGQLGRLVCALAPLVLLGLVVFGISVYRTGFEGSSIRYPNFPSFLWKVQYAYRLVTVIDMAIFLMLLVTLAYHRAVLGPGVRAGLAPFALTVVVTLITAGFLIKLVHGNESVAAHPLPLQNSDPKYERWLVSHSFPASADYITLATTPVLGSDETEQLSPQRFPVGTGSEFGQALPLRVALTRDGYVGTQSLPFQWSTLRVDGHPVSPDRLRLWHQLRPRQKPSRETLRVAVPVLAGTHTIEFAFAPPKAWALLDKLSPWFLVCWIAGLGVVPLVTWGLGERRTTSCNRETQAAPEP